MPNLKFETLVMLSFLFVLSTVHEDVWKVLRRYSQSVVQVIPWALPGHLPNDPERRSQFLHAETWQRRRLEVSLVTVLDFQSVARYIEIHTVVLTLVISSHNY